MKKRFHSILLALLMVLNIFVPSVMAGGENLEESRLVELELQDESKDFESESIQENQLDNLLDIDSGNLEDSEVTEDVKSEEDDIDVNSGQLDYNESNASESLEFEESTERKEEDEDYNVGDLTKVSTRSSFNIKDILTIKIKGGYRIVAIRDGIKIPSGTIILPSEKNGEPILEIGVGVFKEKGLKGTLVIPDTITKIHANAFYGNEITSVIMNGTTEVGGFSFSKNPIEHLQANNLEKVGKAAFNTGNLKELDLPKATTIEQGAFRNNELKTVNIPEAKEVGINSFLENEIEELYAPKLEKAGQNSFYKNRIKTINIESLTEAGIRSFEGNEIEELIAPELVKVGEGAFYENNISQIDAPKLNNIGKNAFAFNQLENLTLDKLPEEIIENPFYINKQGDETFGYFPIFIEGEEKNKVVEENSIVINPDNDFKDSYLGSLDLDEQQDYLFTVPKEQSNGGFVTATNRDEDLLYCVNSEIAFQNGVYNLFEDIEKVYVIEHGNQDEDIAQEVSFNDDKPEEYKYSYEGDLLNKLIWHSNQLISRDEIEYNGKDKIVHLVASNLGLKNQDLTVENFDKIVKETELYKELAEALGKSFMDELFNLIKDDERDYSKGTYYQYAIHDSNIYTVSQSVYKPGEPVEKIDIKVVKTWVGKEADKVTIDLLQNGEKIDSIELSKENDWKHTFKDLDKYDSKGKAFEYTVKEVEIEGYEVAITGSMEEGFVVTNTEKTEEPTFPTYPEPETPDKPEKPSGNNKAPQTGDAGLGFTASTMLFSAAAFVASKKKRK